jgi:transcriptional regulator GlxA family with amidase domain
VGGGTAGVGDDALELVDLLLGTAEGTEPLLGELTGALVLAVAQQLDDTALVGGKAEVVSC